MSEKTRQRVLAVIEELSYQPSMVASALKAKRTFTVGLVVSDITNPFCSSLAKSIEDVAITRGYNVIVASTDNDTDRQHKLIDMLLQKQVDGYIMSPFSEDDEDCSKILSSGRPVVLADRLMSKVRTWAVTSDNVAGGYLATTYLLNQGHRDIALFLEDPRLSSSAQRQRGYVTALHEQGIDVRPEWILSGHFGLDGGRSMLRQLSRVSVKPTAVFAANDLLAIGALQESFALQWRIPEELSIVGYDDIPVASMVHPPLTTVRQPVETMGRVAFDLLLEALEENASARDVVLLPPRLIERASAIAHPAPALR